MYIWFTMNDNIRMAAEIGIFLIAMAFIATPVAAVTMNTAGGSGISVTGWNTQSYRIYTPVNPLYSVTPASSTVFTNFPPSYLNGKYANLNNFLNAGSLNVNRNPITVPSMATSDNNWETTFGSAPAFMYSCGC
jgi:hypothetical protein